MVMPAMLDPAVLPGEDDVQFFQDNGYWKSAKIISDERLVQLRRAMDDVYALKFETGRAPWSHSWSPGDNPMALRKTDNAHWSNNTIRDLATDGVIGAIAAKLLRSPEIRLWHDQLLYKPGGGPNAAKLGANVGWHQDLHYWQCASGELITAWVAFDDVTIANGAMSVVPGSHKWGLLPASDFFNQDLEQLQRKIEELSGQKFQTHTCQLKAGEVSFHHSLTIHGSGPNSTDRPRRSLAVHLMGADCAWQGGTWCDAHMNVVLLSDQGFGPGTLFKGDLWPTLYSELNGTE